MSSSSSFESRVLPDLVCPCCGEKGIRTFYQAKNLPVHSCILMPTREKALAYPKRDLELGHCSHCGFVFNVLFDPSVHEYNETYEETQGFSPTFSAFARQLARETIDAYRLNGKTVLEIGCGKGEFLHLLCKTGSDIKGIGIDPSYRPDRLSIESELNIEFVRELFRAEHSRFEPDFIFSRHTLEHIFDVHAFMSRIRESISKPQVDIWFDLPDAHRVWQEGAFWDVYYEHASYFSLGAVARLFRASGFNVSSLKYEYDDQWLSVGGSLKIDSETPILPEENDLETVERDLSAFVERAQAKIDYWQRRIDSERKRGGKTVVWGGGSKGVAFLTTLGIQDAIEHVVDINPFKAGKFMPGAGQKVIQPEELKTIRPTLVIVMNPIYVDEITATLSDLGLNPSIEACA